MLLAIEKAPPNLGEAIARPFFERGRMCKGVSSAGDRPVLESWERPYTEGLLTREELDHYWREGYVVKKDVLTKEQLEPVIEAINR